MFIHTSERFQFAVECDWNSKISQNARKLGFSERLGDFFWKKSEFTKSGKIAVECVSIGMISENCLFRPEYEVVLTKKPENFQRGKN